MFIETDYNEAWLNNPDKLNELIDGFLSDDEIKTEQLIKCCYRRIFFNCLKLVKDEHVAEDLTHDTFIKALKYKSSFDKTQKFIFWLLKISTNICINYFNEKSKDAKNCVYIDALESEADSVKKVRDLLIDGKAERKIEEKLHNEIIYKAVSLLPLIYRMPVILKYYNDLSYEEISKILDKPIGTIKFRLNRAKAFLMAALGSSFGE